MKRLKFLCFFFIVLISNTVHAQMPCSSGISFNGTDDFIEPDNTDAINLQNVTDRTIEFWFKTSDITNKQVIFEEGGGTRAFIFYLEAGSIYLGAYRNNTSNAADRRFFRSVSGAIEVDKWYHIALTLDNATTLKWYLNGVEQDSQSGFTVESHSGTITLGKNGDNLRYPSSLVSNWSASGGESSETYNNTFTGSTATTYQYAGNVSLFRIWNVARTQSQIDTNKSAFLTSGTSLVAYSDQDRIYYQPNGATEISLTAFVSINTQYTTIPNTDAINLQNTSDRTVEFRFKATDITSRQVLYEEGGNVNAITAFIEDGRFYFGVYRNNAGAAADRKFFRSGSGDINFNQWHHVAVTLDNATTLKWYLDGVEQDSQAGLVVDNHSGDINIGRSGDNIRFPSDLVTGWNASSVGGSTSEYYDSAVTSDGAAYNFTGDFDLFRIWNIARTPSEIDTNKNTLLTSGTDLVAYQSGTQMNYQPNGGGSISATEDAAGVITWDGSDSSVWSTTTNWVGDNAPDATRKQKVTIPDGGIDPVLTTEVSVGFLTVNSGVEIVVEDGATLNVYYGLDNNGTITVENGGSLIYHNCNSSITGSGTFNIKRNSPSYSEAKFFSYWSSPLIEADSSPAPVFLSNTLIYYFDSSITDADWALNGTTAFKPGVGYAVRAESTGSYTATFSGKINEGGISVTTYFNTNEESPDEDNEWSTEGDNLIGNPYSSAIDWDLVVTDTDNDHLEGTIYLWDQQTVEVGDNNVSDYLQYNLTGGASNTATGKIGTGQGFFARSLSGGGTVKFKPTHQIVANNNQFYRGTKSKTDISKKDGRSWFSLHRDNKYASILVGFLEKATEAYDRLYDGPFDINQTALGFYSFVNNTKVSIQGLPELTQEEKIINLGFVVDEVGAHTINMQEEHINDDYHIYLEDTEENTLTNLKEQGYTFTINSVGENNTRFRIIYTKENKTLDVDDEVLLNETFSVYVNALKQLEIKYDREDLIEKVSIYNVLGSEIATYLNKEVKDIANINTGIYIVKTTLSTGEKLAKKILIQK